MMKLSSLILESHDGQVAALRMTYSVVVGSEQVRTSRSWRKVISDVHAQ